MSFGITVVSNGGETIFDSRSKKYYTLVGKMVSRVEPYSGGAVVYINPPTIFNPTNSIFVVKPPQGLNSGGRTAWVGVLPASQYKLRFAPTDGTQHSWVYSPIEVYVYTTLPINAPDSFGLEVKDDNGKVTFNTSKNSLTLQITEQVNHSAALGGKINTKPANGVIISAAFYQIVASSAGYAHPMVQVFRTDGSNIYGAVHTSREAVYTLGGLSFSRSTVALVALPDWDPPIINW